MNTVRCSNRLCEKEYNVQFDNCPFCGTPNPMEESERKAMIEKSKATDFRNSSSDESLFNGWVTGIIWVNIIFFGARGIISSFTNMIFSPLIGCITLCLSIVGIISLLYILSAKKWAFFLWIAYRIAGAVVVSLINPRFSLTAHIIFAVVNILLMIAILQIKKNGVSAWSIIFKRNEKHKTSHNGYPVGRKKYNSSKIKEENTDETIFHQLRDKYTNLTSSQTINIAEVISTNTESRSDLENNIYTINNLDDTPIKKDCTNFDTHKSAKSEDSPTGLFEKIKGGRQLTNNLTTSRFWKKYWLYIFGCVLLIALTYISILNYHNTKGQENPKSETDVIYDCGLFSFTYPSTFKTIPIQNAPHMILKLESDDYIFSVSYWDYGISSDVSIWNDTIFERYQQMPIENGYLVDIDKVGVQTKDGFIKSLKLKSNIHQYLSDTISNLKVLSYIMIHEGYLFVFSFESEGQFPTPIPDAYPTTYPDMIMKGLKLKTNEDVGNKDGTIDNNSYNKKSESTPTFNQEVHDEIKNMAQEYNKELPEELGLGMTMIRCALEKNAMVYTIRWTGMSPSDFSVEDVAEMKEAMIEGLIEEKSSPIMKALLNTMDIYEYYFIYKIENEKGERLCSIKITPSEI